MLKLVAIGITRASCEHEQQAVLPPVFREQIGLRAGGQRDQRDEQARESNWCVVHFQQ